MTTPPDSTVKLLKCPTCGEMTLVPETSTEYSHCTSCGLIVGLSETSYDPDDYDDDDRWELYY